MLDLNNENEKKALYLSEIFQKISKKLKKHEDLILSYSGEESLFLRFNYGKARQVTSLNQGIANLTFNENSRTLNYKIQITGVNEIDSPRMEGALGFCREKVKSLPEDPFLGPLENNGVTNEYFRGNLPSIQSLSKNLFESANGLDFTGCFTMGTIQRANFNSKGQNHFFSTQNFQVDYSFYTDGQKAVKGLYAGSNWNDLEYKELIDQSINNLSKMKANPIKLARGKYKVYLAPDAVSEIIDMFSWGGVSYSSLMRGNSALKLLHHGERNLSEKFSLSEDFSLGLSPRFNDRGEVACENLPIIENGKLKNLLISSRTAKEYSVSSNGAGSYEGLRSTRVKPGDLGKENIFNELEKGIYISNLHYLNWSDIQKGRFTGMTRFACFYVENGEIIAPIEDLRFDESLYDIFGENLICITNFSEVIPNVGSYGMRSLGGKSVPGILVKDFNFTL
jgi:predicted Zn-dependent protease